MATSMTTTAYEQVTENSTSGAIICSTSSDKVGFWGKTPAAQRAFVASVHNTTAHYGCQLIFGAKQLACVQELMNTCINLGIYATA